MNPLPASSEAREAKAWSSWPLGGTAEAVPFPRTIYEMRSATFNRAVIFVD
jgi:hypothetical protein